MSTPSPPGVERQSFTTHSDQAAESNLVFQRRAAEATVDPGAACLAGTGGGHGATPPTGVQQRRDRDRARVQRGGEHCRHDQKPPGPDGAAVRDYRRGRRFHRRHRGRSPRVGGHGGPTTREHRLQGGRAKLWAPLRPHTAHRRHRRRHGPRPGCAGASARRVPPSGRRGGVRIRAAAAGAQPVGAGALHRIPVRVHLLQAGAGLLRQAAHLLRMLLDVPDGDPRGSGGVVEPHPR